jgi:phosphoribosylamine---glycine ligase
VNVLVLGGGGREHALVAALRRSASVKDLYCVPGNGGTASVAATAAVDPADPAALRRFVRDRGIGLLVPGSESYIASGVADLFAENPSVAVFAPTRSAGRLESSKVFGTEFRQRHGIPAPRAVLPLSLAEAETAAERLVAASGGVAVKADGLCAGKGVVVARSMEEAREALHDMLVEGRFGEAGSRVVLEELVQGEEVSVMAVVDGHRAVPLLPSQDYKKLLDGNRGPNTGGMGSYAPVPWFDAAMLQEVQARVLDPTVAGLKRDGIDYRGVLYAGLIQGPEGMLVLEYNARFGDPETEAVLPLLESDLAELMLAACRGELSREALTWHPGAAVCVVLAAASYPGKPRTGDAIEGIADAERMGAAVYHAGTRRDGERLLTAGGRVLGVTAVGADLEGAARSAHAAADRIRFAGAQRRRDIGRIGNGPAAQPLSAL